MAAAQPPLKLNVSGLGAPHTATSLLLWPVLEHVIHKFKHFLIFAGILVFALYWNVAEKTIWMHHRSFLTHAHTQTSSQTANMPLEEFRYGEETSTRSLIVISFCSKATYSRFENTEKRRQRLVLERALNEDCAADISLILISGLTLYDIEWELCISPHTKSCFVFLFLRAKFCH